MMKVELRVDVYRLVEQAVSDGATMALRRATKHVDWSHWEPDERRVELAEDVTSEVMTALCEWIRFSDDDGA